MHPADGSADRGQVGTGCGAFHRLDATLACSVGGSSPDAIRIPRVGLDFQRCSLYLESTA